MIFPYLHTVRLYLQKKWHQDHLFGMSTIVFGFYSFTSENFHDSKRDTNLETIEFGLGRMLLLSSRHSKKGAWIQVGVVSRTAQCVTCLPRYVTKLISLHVKTLFKHCIQFLQICFWPWFVAVPFIWMIFCECLSPTPHHEILTPRNKIEGNSCERGVVKQWLSSIYMKIKWC